MMGKNITQMKEIYNANEHNHIEWSDLSLKERLSVLTDNLHNIPYTGDRLLQVQREIGLIAFELSERYREQTDKAWEEHEG